MGSLSSFENVQFFLSFSYRYSAILLPNYFAIKCFLAPNLNGDSTFVVIEDGNFTIYNQVQA